MKPFPLIAVALIAGPALASEDIADQYPQSELYSQTGRGHPRRIFRHRRHRTADL